MPEYYKIIRIKPEFSGIRTLYYEVLMLNKIPISKTNNFLENNMRIESFLLHARNLINFLDGFGHLKCSEFKDSNNKKISPVKVVPNSVIKKINEHLSYISSKRKTRRISWNLPLLKKEINKKISEFLDKISPNCFPSKERLTRLDFDKIIKN
jgi:hypothetical protein